MLAVDQVENTAGRYQMVAFERYNDGAADYYAVDFGDSHGTKPGLGKRPAATLSSGAFLFARHGQQYNALYREGGSSAWHIVIDAADGPAGIVSIGLSLWIGGTNAAQSAAFHDFTLTEGTCQS